MPHDGDENFGQTEINQLINPHQPLVPQNAPSQAPQGGSKGGAQQKTKQKPNPSKIVLTEKEIAMKKEELKIKKGILNFFVHAFP